MTKVLNDPWELQIHNVKSVIPGQWVLIATHYLVPVPVGHLWYDYPISSNFVSIVNCYTYEHYRRQGVLTRLFIDLRQRHPGMGVFTASGNKMSTPWLKKMGFQQTELGWVLKPVLAKEVKKK